MIQPVKVNAGTYVNPRLSEIILVTGTHGDERRMWVTTSAQPDEAIEVIRDCQDELLRAMKINLPA